MSVERTTTQVRKIRNALTLLVFEIPRKSIEFETVCIYGPERTLFLNVVKITKQKLEIGQYSI